MAITDPNALAHIVEGLGGTVHYGQPNFRFDLPLGKVKETVPRINEITGLKVEKVREYVGPGDPSGPNKVETICELKLVKRPQEPTGYDVERALMAAITR